MKNFKLTITEDQDKITSYNSVDSMSYGNHGSIFKLLTNDVLYDAISCRIDRGCCFIKHQNAAFLEQRPPETK